MNSLIPSDEMIHYILMRHQGLLNPEITLESCRKEGEEMLKAEGAHLNKQLVNRHQEAKDDGNSYLSELSEIDHTHQLSLAMTKIKPKIEFVKQEILKLKTELSEGSLNLEERNHKCEKLRHTLQKLRNLIVQKSQEHKKAIQMINQIGETAAKHISKESQKS